MTEEKTIFSHIIFIFTVGWLLYVGWCRLMMLTHRKEKDGFFVDEPGSKEYPKYFALESFAPYWLFPHIYTEKGNKYRVKFLRAAVFGVLGIVLLTIAKYLFGLE